MVERIDQFDFVHWNDAWMSQDEDEDLEEDEEDQEDE